MATVRRLADLTWIEAKEAAPGAAALWPVGAIEAHGPHLPLATDVIIAEETSRRAAEKLVARGRSVLLLPPLAFTPARFAAAHAGTIGISEGTAAALICDVARAVGGQGVAALALVNAHVDPSHLRALHTAVESIGKALTLNIAFPDITRKPWVLRMPDEFKRGGAHAGFFETSCIMAARPELVSDEVRRGLPKIDVDLAGKIRDGAKTFSECGGPEAYFGDPASATAADGSRFYETLSDMIVEAIG
ncbi:MAG: creatininase family protein [Planctomycetes bacterium]|nr:creatininase family protein [Planctomycetota bacterium]